MAAEGTLSNNFDLVPLECVHIIGDADMQPTAAANLVCIWIMCCFPPRFNDYAEELSDCRSTFEILNTSSSIIFNVFRENRQTYQFA